MQIVDLKVRIGYWSSSVDEYIIPVLLLVCQFRPSQILTVLQEFKKFPGAFVGIYNLFCLIG